MSSSTSAKRDERQSFVLALREAPRRQSICETRMRYEITQKGRVVAEVYFNLLGYCVNPGIPLPEGGHLGLPEMSITGIKREIREINREAKELARMQALKARARTRLQERFGRGWQVPMRPVQCLFLQADNLTHYARASGYTGRRPVLVLDGKVISHRPAAPQPPDWFEFMNRVRAGAAIRRPVPEVRSGVHS